MHNFPSFRISHFPTIPKLTEKKGGPPKWGAIEESCSTARHLIHHKIKGDTQCSISFSKYQKVEQSLCQKDKDIVILPLKT